MHIARNGRTKNRILLPGGVLRRQGANAIQHKDKLRIGRLFHPKRAIIVKHRNAFGGRDISRTTFARDGSDKIKQRTLARAFTPGRQRVRALRECRCWQCCYHHAECATAKMRY